MAGNEFFEDAQNVEDLVRHMPEDEQRRYRTYGDNRIEAAFINRVFIVYRPTGLTSETKRHKEPEILTTIRVTDFSATARSGCVLTLEDQKHGQQMMVTHVPKQLFNFPIFVSIPPRLTLRWDARTVGESVVRTMSFAMFVKMKNKADFYSKGNTYVSTPNEFLRLYPGVAGRFKF